MSDKPFSTTKRILAVLASTGLLLGAATGTYVYWKIHDSLPVLDGTGRVPGLQTAATIERDALGVPSITAGSEADAIRALGYCHAQDRFFQMDMLRRRPAGELSAVIGKSTLQLDSEVRKHEFRRLAEEGFARLPEKQRAMAEAYTQGVNAGLAALSSPPWEYTVLRTKPAPWRAADCLLIGYSMTMELQDAGRYERSLLVLRETLGEKALAFFAPALGPIDSAIDGSRGELPPIPGPEAINLRPKPTAKDPDIQLLDSGHRVEGEVSQVARLARSGVRPVAGDLSANEEQWGGAWIEGAGSNALAVDGAKTGTGSGMVASDMHLGLMVPNTWYRASLTWPDTKGGTTRFTGITFPGAPTPVAGSNGHVAWAFTASFADTCDIVPVDPDGIDPMIYRTPAGEAHIEVRTHRIEVRGQDPIELTNERTLWGPVIGRDAKGKRLALQWVAHQVGAIDLGLGDITSAKTCAEAAAIGRASGVPALNMLIADDSGAVGWTLAGRLPERQGFSGRLPVVRTFGDRAWKGLLRAEENPSLLYPKEGYLSSGNERLFGGERLAVLGDGGYESPHRGRQLREGLAKATEKGGVRQTDLLAIQLDNRAQALAPWRSLLASTLSKPGAVNTEERRLLLTLAKDWDLQARADSRGHLVTRTFRSTVERLIMAPLMAPCLEQMPEFRWTRFNSEPAILRILEERPLHLLAPEYKDWDTLLLAAADETADKCDVAGGRSWGDENTAAIRHPLLRPLPRWMTRWADMPADPLPGDSDMPRVLKPAFGASERFAVSPGRENEGYLHMPGGQSANPLSPYFRAGHEAWVKGEPTPFLPGPTKHTFVLKP